MALLLTERSCICHFSPFFLLHSLLFPFPPQYARPDHRFVPKYYTLTFFITFLQHTIYTMTYFDILYHDFFSTYSMTFFDILCYDFFITFSDIRMEFVFNITYYDFFNHFFRHTILLCFITFLTYYDFFRQTIV